MKVTFVDLGTLDYNVETPYHKPLGGSQSAMCYLAENLAQLGHEIYLINNTKKTGIYRGVYCYSLEEINTNFFSNIDVLIIQNRPSFGFTFKNLISKNCSLILWSQHAEDQPAVQDLLNPELVNIYDQIVLISNWQCEQYLKTFPISSQKITILQNAVSPTFIDLFPNNQNILKHKTQPPILAYTSTPFRGLDLLLEIFPYLRQFIPEITLKVFSSMKVYQTDENNESKYKWLYEQCQNTDGVEYIGSISQTELAKELKSVSILIYPNTFPETSCIAVMEAMASGCYIITSDLGALPETSANFGCLIPVDENWQKYNQFFIEKTIEILKKYQNSDTETLENHLQKQVNFVNHNYNWTTRSQEWINFLIEAKFQQFYKYQLYEEALTFFEEEININCNINSNYWYLGLILLLLGDTITAQTTWMTAMLDDEGQIKENQQQELLNFLNHQLKELASNTDENIIELMKMFINDLSS